MANDATVGEFEDFIRPVMMEIVVMKKKRDLGVGICYASGFSMEPAHALGRALGELYRGDEYRIERKVIGRSTFNPQPERQK